MKWYDLLLRWLWVFDYLLYAIH